MQDSLKYVKNGGKYLVFGVCGPTRHDRDLALRDLPARPRDHRQLRHPPHLRPRLQADGARARSKVQKLIHEALPDRGAAARARDDEEAGAAADEAPGRVAVTHLLVGARRRHERGSRRSPSTPSAATSLASATRPFAARRAAPRLRRARPAADFGDGARRARASSPPSSARGAARVARDRPHRADAHGRPARRRELTPVRPAILWCDTPHDRRVRGIRDALGDERARARPSATAPLEGFTLPKLLWLRQHEPEVYARIESRR